MIDWRGSEPLIGCVEVTVSRHTTVSISTLQNLAIQ